MPLKVRTLANSRFGTVLVDPRAGSKELKLPLRKAGHRVRFSNPYLRSADVAFMGHGPITKARPDGLVRVGIEFKKFGEALVSFHDGRLVAKQHARMLEDYDYRFVIVEGVIQPTESGLIQESRYGRWEAARTRMTWAGYQKFRMTMLLHMATLVETTRSRLESILLISAIHRYFTEKRWSEHGSHLTFDESPAANMIAWYKHTPTRLVAKDLPHIGWKMSTLMDERWKTPHDMFTAPFEEWLKFRGIGYKVASDIWIFIHGRAPGLKPKLPVKHKRA